MCSKIFYPPLCKLFWGGGDQGKGYECAIGTTHMEQSNDPETELVEWVEEHWRRLPGKTG